MKVVLTGATGFVGGVVLAQLLDHPAVKGVTALTRRPIARSHPKLTEVMHPDFSTYDEELLNRLAAHHACLWTLGGKASELADPKEYERITHTFTLALANGIAPRARDFCFCYLSGMGADRTESTWLSWERATRHLKGRTEKDLAALASEHEGFSAYSFRPGGILPAKGSGLVEGIFGRWVVRVDALAKAMIHVAINAHPRGTILNAEINAIARAPESARP